MPSYFSNSNYSSNQVRSDLTEAIRLREERLALREKELDRKILELEQWESRLKAEEAERAGRIAEIDKQLEVIKERERKIFDNVTQQAKLSMDIKRKSKKLRSKESEMNRLKDRRPAEERDFQLNPQGDDPASNPSSVSNRKEELSKEFDFSSPPEPVSRRPQEVEEKLSNSTDPETVQLNQTGFEPLDDMQLDPVEDSSVNYSLDSMDSIVAIDEDDLDGGDSGVSEIKDPLAAVKNPNELSVLKADQIRLQAIQSRSFTIQGAFTSDLLADIDD